MLFRSSPSILSWPADIGYEKAAELAKYAYENRLNIKEAILDKGIFTKDEIEDILKNNLIKEQ